VPSFGVPGFVTSIDEQRGPTKKRLPQVGSLRTKCVGVPRFELGTSRTRTVRSTGLSHTPKQRRTLYLIFFIVHYGFKRISWLYT
jgi:hypothetical protein